MTISYVGHALGGPTTGTSAPTSLPSGAAVGDLLLLGVRASGMVLRVGTPPAGWTKLTSGWNSGDNYSFAWFQRIHDGSAAPTVTWDGTSVTWMFTLAAWHGVAQSRPVGDYTQYGLASPDSAPTVPSLTTTDPASVVVWTVLQSAGVTTTPPAGFAQRLLNVTTGFAIADAVVAVPGATGAMTGSFSSAAPYMAAAFVLVPAAERLTIDPTDEDPANVPLELIGGAYDLVELRTPTPALDPRWAQPADADGDRLAGLRYQNRELTLTLEVVPAGATAAADVQQALAALADKLAKINRDGGTLRRVLPSGDSVTFDLLSADAIDPPWQAEWKLARSIRVDVHLTAKPFARGVEEARATHTETSRPVLVFTETGIAGDVPALGRLVVTDAQGDADRAWAQWGLQLDTYDPASTAALFYEAEACTPLNLGALVTLSGASGSGSNAVSSGTLAPGWAAILSTKSSGGAQLTHVGEYRVLARLYRPTTNTGQVGVALEWALGDFRAFTRNTPVYYAADQLEGSFTIADLGRVSIPSGTSRWEGRVIANSTVKGDTLSIDCLWLVPTERSGEASARWWATSPYAVAAPTAYLVRDEFKQSTGAATGKTLPIGGTYVGAGDADDFTITGGALQRTATSDAAGGPNAGRLLVANGASSTSCIARTGMSASDQQLAVQGLLLRYTDASNHVAVGVVNDYFNPYVSVQKCVGGTYTTLAQSAYPSPMVVNTRYQLYVLINAAGQLSVWVTMSTDPSTPLIQVADTALATGGTLASGQVGLFDHSTSAKPVTRSFYNFWAWAPDRDAAIFAGASVQVGPDDVTRQDAGKALWTPVARYEGDLLTIPPSGLEGRTARFLVTASRASPGEGFDRTIDDLGAQLFVTPRYLVVP